MPSTKHLAAIDLGSNSFHALIARDIDGDVQLIDKLRERVRLAAGLDDDGNLSPEARARALDCLARFRERLDALPDLTTRVVGTNTFRVARDARGFIAEAEGVLGTPIEVISGEEEARLVYLGVASRSAPLPRRRLVIDIGGGSTECIVGDNYEYLAGRSLRIGCVSFSERYFAGGDLGADSFRRAETAARLELRNGLAAVKHEEWDIVLGSSGTVHAIAAVVRQNGWSENGITLRSLEKLRKALIRAGSIDKLELPGLREDRRPVIAGGFAILSACFGTFEMSSMTPAKGALREGLMYEWVDPSRHDDVRDHTLERMIQRYRIDAERSARTAETALQLLDAVAPEWSLQKREHRDALAWAARLCEAGLSVAHSGHHKHGAYLIANSHMAGFTYDQQFVIAQLVRSHRRKIPGGHCENWPHFSPLEALRLVVLLRLAVLLERSRIAGEDELDVTVGAEGDSLDFEFAPGWLDSHPLTYADLELESAYLTAWNMKLSVS